MAGTPRLANRVLELLYDRGGESVWLDELTAAVGGLERAALAAALQELEARGHRLERSPTGVRLVQPTALDAHLIERDLPVEQIGRHVICFGEVSSTNDVAFDCALQAQSGPLVITAESQTAGRGRLGRSWHSPPGTGILASAALAGAAARLSHEALTIAAGLAVAEGIEQATGVKCELEWPNDVVFQAPTAGRTDRGTGRPAKLAGVLVELRGTRAACRTVVGFGINVTATPPPEQVDRPVTCLAEAAPEEGHLERIEILRGVLIRLDRWVAAVRAGRNADLHDRWLARCAMLNRRVCVACADRRFTGRIVDVSPLQGLILLTDSGEQVRLPAATSSIVR